MSLEDSILMSVGGLTIDPMTKTPIVILKDRDNKLNLPIWIGLLEATAMATEIEGIKMARPMTHDLLRNVLAELGATVQCVEITDLKDNTYFALIHIRINGSERTIDSRPSDAISLALRTKSPIYVNKRVIETSISTEGSETSRRVCQPRLAALDLGSGALAQAVLGSGSGGRGGSADRGGGCDSQRPHAPGQRGSRSRPGGLPCRSVRYCRQAI